MIPARGLTTNKAVTHSPQGDAFTQIRRRSIRSVLHFPSAALERPLRYVSLFEHSALKLRATVSLCLTV